MTQKMFQNLERSMGANELLKIECQDCGRRTTWSRTDAIARLGADATPADIRWRLSCTNCKRSGRARVWI